MQLRALTAEDKPLLQAWIEKDPDHSGKGMTADFFYEAGADTFMVEDEEGVVMCLRLSRALRLDMQFNDGDKARTAKVLQQLAPWVREQAKAAGFKQMIFESVAKPLIAFCRRRLGFKPSRDEYLSLL